MILKFNIIKYLFFSDYFLVIARFIYQYSIIVFRWTTLLFSKNKEVLFSNITHITKPIFKDELIDIKLNLENVLWIECHFNNPRKLYRTKNISNDFFISYFPNDSIPIEQIQKLIYTGDYIKTTDNHIKFWNKFNDDDKIYIIARGFNKRRYEFEIELTAKNKIDINSIKLKNKEIISLKKQHQVFKNAYRKIVSLNPNNKVKLNLNTVELTQIKNLTFSNNKPNLSITPFIKSNYL